MNLIDKILKEASEEVLNKKIKNPATGRSIKVSSALNYDDSEPVKRKALSMIKRAEKKANTPVQTTQKAVVAPEANDTEPKKSHKPKSNSYGISKECVAFLKEKGLTGLNVYPQSFVKPEEVQLNPALNDKNKNNIWVAKFPVILPNGKKAYKTAYTSGFMKKSQVKKYKKISKIKDDDITKLDEKTNKLLSAKNREIASSACVLRIILKTGLRVGSADNADSGNLGVRTLLKKNIKVEGNTVKLNFIGKSYQENNAQIEDEALANYLKNVMANKKDDERVFDCSYGAVSKVMDKINPKGINPKDLRTYKATQFAKELVEKIPTAKIKKIEKPKERKRVIKDYLKGVFDKVASMLNNSPAMARNSYVHPVIITNFLDKLGLQPKEVGYKHVTLESKQLKESILSSEEKKVIDDSLAIIKRDKFGPERQTAVSNIIRIAQSKTKGPINSIRQALLNLDYIQTPVHTIPSLNSMLKEEISTEPSMSMDDLFAKYPEYAEGDEGEINEEDMYDCEEYLLPEWWWNENIELLEKE